VTAMIQAPCASDIETPVERLGIAILTRAAFSGRDLTRTAAAFRNALASDPADAGALMDLSVIEQLHGNPEGGLALQAAALEHAQVYRTASAAPKTLRLLALAAPVAMGGNTPVDFLVEHSTVGLDTLYIAPGLPLPDPLPEHDLAIVIAPGDSDDSRQFLTEIDRRLADWPRPVLNAPADIMRLDRDRTANILAHVPGLILPGTARCTRAVLRVIGDGDLGIRDVRPEFEFPIIIRPVGAHAGRGLEKLTSAADIGPYLDTCDDPDFFLSDFVDYGSADGGFRKYRIVLVDGRPHPCHMAIADGWKVWYMNADMAGSPQKRREEQRFMERFDTGFGHRHGAALSAMAQAFGLDYFGIDCAEDRAGNLVLFEADNALIVHDMDSAEIFPYKSPVIRTLFDGFVGMVARRAQRQGAVPEKRRTG